MVLKENLNQFSLRIKELMRENGEMSRTDLSHVAQCDLHSITLWLNGIYYPRLHTLILLSNYFHTTIDFLLGQTESDIFIRSDSPISFSSRLNELMHEQKFSRYALAKKLGTKTTTVSKWLNQVNMPETINLIKLSKIFDVSIEYLVGLSTNEYIGN